jgi:hypothetical protein
MSSHLWDVKRFKPETVEAALVYFRWLVGRETSLEAATTFVGYALERQRQAGGGTALPLAPSVSIRAFWDRLESSGHRYARGRNAGNYAAAGHALLRVIAPAVGLTEDAPTFAVYDRLKGG